MRETGRAKARPVFVWLHLGWSQGWFFRCDGLKGVTRDSRLASGFPMLDWSKLLTDVRRSTLHPDDGKTPEVADTVERRSEWERDYDRILFCTPVRRLADKTQVFPLERHDSVRTRLTHSHEVSNLARGMGMFLACDFEKTKGVTNSARTFPPIMAAVGLAHDLGNPPFGHQGEVTIQRWFQTREHDVFGADEKASDAVKSDIRKLTPAMKQDFLHFEGNAQTFRLLTRHQQITNDLGLNLTLATLGTLMKYTVPSDGVAKTAPSKKPGYFQSEEGVVQAVRDATGLSAGQRHPLTWLVEACDDIAYLTIDAEDAVKKGLVSAPDLLSFLEVECGDVEQVRELVAFGREQHTNGRAKYKLSPSEANDVAVQRIRVNVIGLMTGAVLDAFTNNYDAIMNGAMEKDLLSSSSLSKLAKALKTFDVEHAYRHRSVLELELHGFNTITQLMNMLWEGITKRESYEDTASRRTTPFAAYAYGRISENYRRIFEGHSPSAKDLPIRYREAQLLTDMIAGMTDSYALQLHHELERYYVGKG